MYTINVIIKLKTKNYEEVGRNGTCPFKQERVC